MKLLASYTIYGEPASKKNSKNVGVNPYSGQTFVHSSKRFQRWEAMAKLQLRAQKAKNPHATITTPVLVTMRFFKAFANAADISNLYEGPQDLLQEFGILENDNQIIGHDGSRIYLMCGQCPKREVYQKGPKAGTFKEDCGAKRQCPYNRTEIEIYAARIGKLSPSLTFKDREEMLRELRIFAEKSDKTTTKFMF